MTAELHKVEEGGTNHRRLHAKVHLVRGSLLGVGMGLNRYVGSNAQQF